MRLPILAGLLALAVLVGDVRPARADSCVGPTTQDPFRLACDVCNTGWSGALALTVPVLGAALASSSSARTERIAPFIAGGSAIYLGTEIGFRLLSGEVRPVEDWVIIFVTRTLAALLTLVAVRELNTAGAVVSSLALGAASAVPLFVLKPEELF
jgi:hypothetical protein